MSGPCLCPARVMTWPTQGAAEEYLLHSGHGGDLVAVGCEQCGAWHLEGRP